MEQTTFFERTALLCTVLSINMLYIFPIIETLGIGTGYSLQRIAAVLLVSSALALIAFGGMMTLMSSLSDYSSFTKATYLLLVAWCMVVIMKSFSMSIGEIWQLFNRADGAGPWLIPLVMMLGGQLRTWQRLNRVFIVHTVIAIFFAVIVILFFQSETSAFRPFGFYRFGMLYAGGFLLLSWRYQQPFGRKVGMLGVLTYGFIAFLGSARHGLLTTLYLLFAFMFIRQLQVQGLINKIRGVYLNIFGIIALLLSLFVIVNASEYFSSRYNKFTKKIGQDSRSIVIKEFVEYTNKSSHMITGAGALGMYETRLFLDRGINKRENIENGYLQVVLKGGIVMLVLFLLITVPAAFMGLFYSKNWFTRMTGFLVFGRLVDMFPYGIPWTDPSYILFWLCVGACLNRRFRRMNDSEIYLRLAVPESA